MKTRLVGAALGSVLLGGLAGCAHYPANAPKTADRADGYYYEDHKRQNDSDDIGHQWR